MPRPALPAANLLYNGASSYSSPYSTLVRTLAGATVPASIQGQIQPSPYHPNYLESVFDSNALKKELSSASHTKIVKLKKRNIETGI